MDSHLCVTPCLGGVWNLEHCREVAAEIGSVFQRYYRLITPAESRHML